MFFIIQWDKRYKLQEVPQESYALVDSQYFSKEVDTSGNSLPIDIQSLLHKFESIFEEPNALPPFRQHIHSIPLIPNSKPPSIRPYHYPYFQKSEIKNQISELLRKGYIRSSTRPFASPVLIVKKKDIHGACAIDYRGLNQITIQYKYPIPNLMSELLDKLHGAPNFFED